MSESTIHAPSMWTIRAAVAADAEPVIRVHTASWRSTYTGLIDGSILDDLERRLDAQVVRRQRFLAQADILNLVAVTAQDHVVGFLDAGPAGDDDRTFPAELYGLYLLKGWQKQGIGTKLVAQAASTLFDSGYPAMKVWVLAQNPARAFYERRGGELVGQAPLTLGSYTYTVVAYGWRDLRTLVRP